MSDPKNILVVQPSWVGDAVMATPTLRALRAMYPEAHIAYLLRRYVKPLYVGIPWADRLITYRIDKAAANKGGADTGRGLFNIAGRIRAGQFDLAVLLTNSFKTALMCSLGGVKRRVGYDRDGRGFLLTDRLAPLREGGRFVPTPIIHTYMDLAKHLKPAADDLKMELFVTDRQRRAAEAVFARCDLPIDLHRPAAAGQPPLVLLNPGANYGAAKCWPAEYFANLADRLIERHNARVLLSAAPKERPIVQAIMAKMKRSAIDLSTKGVTLGSLLEIVRRCDLMVTNDTGPRHIAVAMDVPVVTIFGPTHPQWTEIYYAKERQVAVKVFCGPCQKKICPLDHRCMIQATPAMVYDAAAQLMGW